MAPTVDEEGRGAGDSAEVGTVDVLGDAVGARVLAQVAGKALDIEAELLRVRDPLQQMEDEYRRTEGDTLNALATIHQAVTALSPTPIGSATARTRKAPSIAPNTLPSRGSGRPTRAPRIPPTMKPELVMASTIP